MAGCWIVTVDLNLFMYRNRPVKGFVSPLIVPARTSAEESENEVSACREKSPCSLVREPFRSNLQILNLFEKVIRENEVERDNVQVRTVSPRKQNASSPMREKQTSIVASPQTATKMYIFKVNVKVDINVDFTCCK